MPERDEAPWREVRRLADQVGYTPDQIRELRRHYDGPSASEIVDAAVEAGALALLDRVPIGRHFPGCPVLELAVDDLMDGWRGPIRTGYDRRSCTCPVREECTSAARAVVAATAEVIARGALVGTGWREVPGARQ